MVKDPFRPGELVLAKFPGYQPWPSLVMANAHITDEVRKNCQDSRKEAHGTFIYVYFFGDHNFSLLPDTKIQRLTVEQARAKLKEYEKKKSKSKGLIDAFAEAIEYEGQKTYWEVLVDQGLVDENEKPYVLKTIDELPKGKKKRSAVQETTTEPNKKRHVQSPQPAESKKKKQAKKQLQQIPPEDGEAQAPKPTPQKEAAASKRAAKDKKVDKNSLEYRQSEAYMIRFLLQKGLIQRTTEVTEQELKECDKSFQQLEALAPDMDIDVLRHSKLYKVMAAIARNPSLARPEDFKFVQRAEKLVVLWAPLVQKLKEEKERETPNTSVLDVSQIKSEVDTQTQLDSLLQSSNGNGKILSKDDDDEVLPDADQSITTESKKENDTVPATPDVPLSPDSPKKVSTATNEVVPASDAPEAAQPTVNSVAPTPDAYVGTETSHA